MKRPISKGLVALLLVAFVWFLGGSRRPDRIVLTDGTTLSGMVVSETAQTITFKTQDGPLRRYERNQIKSMQVHSK